MSGPHEPIRYSPWHTPWPNEVPAPAFTSDVWQRSMVESFQQDITEHRLVHRTAPIRRPRFVTARFTLKLTPLHTRQGMEYLSRELNFLRRTAPAIHARVCSLMRVYQPWCLLANIETIPDSGYWLT